MIDEAKVDTRAETEWLADVHELHSECTARYLEVSGELETHFPGLDLYNRAKRGVEAGLPVLRLLCYKQAEVVGEQIAKMHTDRCWLTLHLNDSAPGLTFPMNGVNVEYVKQAGKVLVFPGKKARKITENRLPALPHGVVAHPSTVGGRRWTVVFFGHIDLQLTDAELKEL